MRRTHAALIGLLLATVAAAHPFAQDIRLASGLRTGDEFQVEITRTRENSTRPQQNGLTRTAVTVRVLSAAATGFVVEWTPGPPAADNARTSDPVTAAAVRALEALRFRFTLNADGVIAGLDNLADVESRIKNAVDVVVNDMVGRLPPEGRQVFVTLSAPLLSPAALVASATREAEMYFSLSGAELAIGESVETTLDMPSPAGGGVIPAKYSVRLDSATAETAMLHATTTYDSAALVRMTQALARQAGAVLTPEQLAQMPPMQMADEGTFAFDRRLGVMRQVTVRRRASAGDALRLDGWDIRLVNGPTR